MERVGIWLDKKQAKILKLSNGKEEFLTLKSEVEFFHPSGGGRAPFKWGGTQDVVRESSYMEREKQQLRNYFKNLVDIVGETDAIAVFGPAITREKFGKELIDRYPALASKIKVVAKKDSMTDNQIKALIKDFYKD
ncbi:MAG: hypothetical protein ACKVJF_10130 [Flavobacteriales bacterium]